MNWHRKSDSYFFYATLICMIVSILLASIFFSSVKKDLSNQLKGIELVVGSNTDFDAILYYTYTKNFDEKHTIKNSGIHKDTLFFQFPKASEMVRKFRLDFGNDPKLQEVKIKSFTLLFNDKRIAFDEEETFKSRFLASPSVFLNKKNHLIEINTYKRPFDPYIVFPHLGQLAITRLQYALLLLTPFMLLLIIYVIKYRKENKLTILNFLALIFIICIPLKIAWTTFSALLLCAYGIGHAVRSKKIVRLNSTFFIFTGIFLLVVILGRPATFSAMDKLFSLPLFAVLGITISFPKPNLYRYFVFIFLIFNAIVVSSGIHFLIWFNDFYGMQISDYFIDIKTYSDIMRSWLYYEHAAFLSFFGLVGMLFAHSLFHQQRLEKKVLFFYDILLLMFILLVGTRICLLIYVVFLLNLFVKWDYKKRLLINAILFFLITGILMYNIDKIDQNRYDLWTVSWNAIKEKPWFGYGLGASNEILHNNKYLADVNFTEELPLNHSHNQFITFLLEIGIVGITVLAAFLFYLIYRTKLYRNTIFVLFFVGLGYMFLTESILETSKPLYVLCFIFLAITYKIGTENDIRPAF